MLDVQRVLVERGIHVNLTMGSPPYDAARTYGIGFNLKGEDWVRWAFERYMACLAISDLVCWVDEGTTNDYRWSATPALLMADLHRAGVHLRKPPAYVRVSIPGGGGPDWFRNDYEFCICGTKGGKLPWSDNKACGHPPKWAPGGEMSHRLTDGSRRNQWGGGENSTKSRRPNGTRQKAGRPSHVVVANGDRLGRGNEKGSTKIRFGHGDGGTVKGGHAQDIVAIANPGNVIRPDVPVEEVIALLEHYEHSDVIKCKVGGGLIGSRIAHENEAPYPEKLAERFVLSCCPPGGWVWDPFSGSGTTAAVALKHGRNVIASDIRGPEAGEKDQLEKTLRRIKEVVGDLNFDGTVEQAVAPGVTA